MFDFHCNLIHLFFLPSWAAMYPLKVHGSVPFTMERMIVSYS